jgi:hypothetical protein
VSVYSALAVARHVIGADAVVIAMGPGIVGTGTRLGFSGIEVGPALDAAAGLRGDPIVCLRVSFADERPRHQGVSHHTLTTLRPGVPQPGDDPRPEGGRRAGSADPDRPRAQGSRRATTSSTWTRP